LKLKSFSTTEKKKKIRNIWTKWKLAGAITATRMGGSWLFANRWVWEKFWDLVQVATLPMVVFKWSLNIFSR
jgi:hypothetical protein